MVGLALVGTMLKGSPGGDPPEKPAAVAAVAVASPPPAAVVPASPVPTSAPVAADADPGSPPVAAAGVDDSLPTGSIDPGSALHRPNPAAYGDAARDGSSLVITGAEAVNYLAGNTLKRQSSDAPARFTYFASRGVMAEGTEREFVARTWDRNRADLCEAGADGTPACRPIRILLDAKEELQGGRLGTVTIGDETAELIKGNVLRVPPHIPFLDSAVALDAAPPHEETGAAWANPVDHTAAITTDAGAGRRFVFFGADNKMLDVQPIEAGPGGGRAVRVGVGHWRLSKATLCENGAASAAQVCFKPEPADGGTVRLVPVAKGGEALRAVFLPETRIRAVAED